MHIIQQNRDFVKDEFLPRHRYQVMGQILDKASAPQVEWLWNQVHRRSTSYGRYGVQGKEGMEKLTLWKFCTIWSIMALTR